MRDDSEADILLDEFDRLNVQLIVNGVPVDRSTPHGWMGFKVTSMFDEAYSRTISYNVKKALAEKQRQGYYVGKLPLGYSWTEAKPKTLVPNEDADVVRLAFTLYATGNYTLNDVAEELNRRCYRALNKGRDRVPFSQGGLQGILRNDCYTKAWAGDALIIHVEVFERVQQIRRERGVLWHGSAVRHDDVLLAGLVWCAACGGKMHVHHSGDGVGRYYQCYYRKLRHCSERTVPGALADALLTRWVQLMRVPEQDIRRIVEMAAALVEEQARPTNLPTPEQIARRAEGIKQLYKHDLM